MMKEKNIYFKELETFSKENWWIYIILFFCLFIVYFTGKGNLLEIITLFIANFLGNLFIMIMQYFYTNGENKKGAINQLVSVSIFTLISLYGLIFNGEYQYIIWQIMYLLAAINTFSFYVLKKNLKNILNENTFLLINIGLLIIFMLFIPHENYSILQGIGFSLITIGLVSIKDNIRYILNVFGVVGLTIGSLWGVINSYNLGDLDGVSLGFFLLTGTVFVFYVKLLPTYFDKIKLG